MRFQIQWKPTALLNWRLQQIPGRIPRLTEGYIHGKDHQNWWAGYGPHVFDRRPIPGSHINSSPPAVPNSSTIEYWHALPTGPWLCTSWFNRKPGAPAETRKGFLGPATSKKKVHKARQIWLTKEVFRHKGMVDTLDNHFFVKGGEVNFQNIFSNNFS